MANLTKRTSVKCPLCGAAPGQPCSGSRGPRRSVHVERWQRKLARNRAAKAKEKQ